MQPAPSTYSAQIANHADAIVTSCVPAWRGYIIITTVLDVTQI